VIWTSTWRTPGTWSTASRTQAGITSCAGQPGVVSVMVTITVPSQTSIPYTSPRSTTDMPNSGSKGLEQYLHGDAGRGGRFAQGELSPTAVVDPQGLHHLESALVATRHVPDDVPGCDAARALHGLRVGAAAAGICHGLLRSYLVLASPRSCFAAA
jgi:hypothetical protein